MSGDVAPGPRAGWTGALLVGGRSRRMGQDKLLLSVAGERLVDRPAAALRATCARLCCVGRELGLGDFTPLVDARPGCGPLGGLVAALEHAGEGFVLALAGDLPEVDAAFLARLQAEAEKEPASVLIPRCEGRLEPLAAAWPASLAAPLRAELEADRLSLHRCLEQLPHRVWQLDGAAKMRAPLRNLNAPQDWQAFTGGPLPRDDPDRA